MPPWNEGRNNEKPLGGESATLLMRWRVDRLEFAALQHETAANHHYLAIVTWLFGRL
jgi:hypothetical protein